MSSLVHNLNHQCALSTVLQYFRIWEMRFRGVCDSCTLSFYSSDRLKVENRKFNANFARKVTHSILSWNQFSNTWMVHFAGSQMCDGKTMHQYLARHLIFLLQPSVLSFFFKWFIFVKNIPRNMSYNRKF